MLTSKLFKFLTALFSVVVIGFAVYLFKKKKNDLLQKKELEETLKAEQAEKLAILQQEWEETKAKSEQMEIEVESIDEQAVKVEAYDGDMNSMTFNFIKNSQVFAEPLDFDEVFGLKQHYSQEGWSP